MTSRREGTATVNRVTADPLTAIDSLTLSELTLLTFPAQLIS